MKLHKIQDVVIEVTPHDIAKLFCDMMAQEQAEFFNHVSSIAERWDGTIEQQMENVSKTDLLNKGGKRVMRAIGEYSGVI